MEFDKYGCKVNNGHGTIVAEARKEKNLYFSMSMFERRVQMWQSL